MTTKKEIIVKRFLKYEHDIKQIIDASILPSLEDIDVCDFLIFINLYFNNDNDKQTTIYNLISMQGLDINKEDIAKAMPLTLQLIEWLLIFQKKYLKFNIYFKIIL